MGPSVPAEPATLAIAAAFLILGGVVKGVLGIGLPLVSVPLLSLLMPIPTAVAVMGLPVLVSNIVQLRQGTALRPAFARFWPLLLALIIGILIGARLLATLDEQHLSLMLGAMVIGFASLNLAGPEIVIPARLERAGGAVVGLAAGLLGGFSSFFGPPIVMYMVALGLPKDAFVSTIAMVYTTGTVPLYLSLVAFGIFGIEEATASAFALLPVLAGLAIGQRLRRRIPQRIFRLMVLVMLLAIGASLIRRGLFV